MRKNGLDGNRFQSGFNDLWTKTLKEERIRHRKMKIIVALSMLISLSWTSLIVWMIFKVVKNIQIF